MDVLALASPSTHDLSATLAAAWSTPTVAAAWQGFLLWIALVATIGPQNALLIKQGARRRAVGVVIAIYIVSDVLFVYGGTFGVGIILDRLPWLLDVLRWVGVVYLLWFGATCVKDAIHPRAAEEDGPGSSPAPSEGSTPRPVEPTRSRQADAVVAVKQDGLAGPAGRSWADTNAALGGGTCRPALPTPHGVPLSPAPTPVLATAHSSAAHHHRSGLATPGDTLALATSTAQLHSSSVDTAPDACATPPLAPHDSTPAGQPAPQPGLSARLRHQWPLLRKPVLLALVTTWLNPGAWIDGFVMLGSLANQYGPERWSFASGALVATCLWFPVVGYGAAAMATTLAKPAVWRGVNVVVAGMMGVFAAKLAFGL